MAERKAAGIGRRASALGTRNRRRANCPKRIQVVR
jgi:hypothetical protein